MCRQKPKTQRIATDCSVFVFLLVLVAHHALASGQRADGTTLEFSEQVVAGGPDDFMTVRHLRLRGSHRAIGKKLAEIARDRHGLEPVQLEPQVLNERHAFYKNHHKLHYKRSLGAREAYGAIGETGIDLTVLPYNLPARFSCSVVYYPPSHTESGHGTLSRNYDWITGTWMDMFGSEASKTKRTTEDPYVIEVYPHEGYPSLVLCAYELLGGGLDGINAEGLTIALLANTTKERAAPTHAWRPGLSEIELVRYVLESCATVAEAKRALSQISIYYMVLPCHYIIGDRHGKSFVWEYSADLTRRFIVDGKGKPQWVTNHPVHMFPTADSVPATLQDSTFARFRRLDEEIAKAGPTMTMAEITHANRCVSDTDETDTTWRTLWHSIYDCTNNSLNIDFYLGENPSGGGQRRSGYIRFQLKQSAFKLPLDSENNGRLETNRR